MSSQIDHLLNEDRRFAPSPAFAATAVGDADLYARADSDRERFWADQARELLHWHTPFTQLPRSLQSEAERLQLIHMDSQI